MSRTAVMHQGSRRLAVSAAAARLVGMGLIWREASADRLGLTGHVELVDAEGKGDGRRLGVRVQACSSAVVEGDHWRVELDRRLHRFWAAHPLPLILVLHDPAGGDCWWADLRSAASDDASPPVLQAPKKQRLDQDAVHALAACASSGPTGFLEEQSHVLGRMVERTSPNPYFPVSYFDLFAHGLTDITRALYFGSDLALTIAEARLPRGSLDLRVGARDHEFLFGFVRFLVAQNLATFDFSTSLLDWIEKGRQPQFVAPLTPRGRALVKLIQTLERGMADLGGSAHPGYSRVAQEAFFGMAPQSLRPRLQAIQAFQRALRDQPQEMQPAYAG